MNNAELVKALVLKKDEHEEGELEDGGHRWEAIEQGLCNDELWGFISGEEKATRIDLVLEVYARSRGFIPDRENENALFDWYEKLYGEIDNQRTFSEQVLNGIEERYNRIREWYDDVEIFHYMGLLSCYHNMKLTDYKTKEELVKTIFDLYNDSEDRDEFVKSLSKMIKDCILYHATEEPNTFDELLGLYSYQEGSEDQAELKAILWLVNVWETIQSAENNIQIGEKNKKRQIRKPIVVRRLPFSQINGKLTNKEVWTLEHIMPQKPDDTAKEEDQKNYAELENEIESKNLKDSVVSGEDEIHRLGNMALLTRSTNSSIRNCNLDVKRKDIINKIGEGEYVPISTINVFSMYYNMLDKERTPSKYDDFYWTLNDRDSYLKRIKECLRIYSVIGTEDV